MFVDPENDYIVQLCWNYLDVVVCNNHQKNKSPSIWNNEKLTFFLRIHIVRVCKRARIKFIIFYWILNGWCKKREKNKKERESERNSVNESQSVIRKTHKHTLFCSFVNVYNKLINFQNLIDMNKMWNKNDKKNREREQKTKINNFFVSFFLLFCLPISPFTSYFLSFHLNKIRNKYQ